MKKHYIYASAGNKLLRSQPALVETLNIFMYDNKPPIFEESDGVAEILVKDSPSSFLKEFEVVLPEINDPDGDILKIDTTKKWDGTNSDFKIEVDSFERKLKVSRIRKNHEGTHIIGLRGVDPDGASSTYQLTLKIKFFKVLSTFSSLVTKPKVLETVKLEVEIQEEVV